MKIQFLGIYVWHSGALLIESLVKMVGIKKPRIVQNFNTLLLFSICWFPNQRHESIPKNNEIFFCLSEDGRKKHLVKSEWSPKITGKNTGGLKDETCAKRQVRFQASDNAHRWPKAPKWEVEAAQRCPAQGDGWHRFRASSSWVPLELHRLRAKRLLGDFSWAGAAQGGGIPHSSDALVRVGATGQLSIFQNEADCVATWLQIWELPSR